MKQVRGSLRVIGAANAVSLRVPSTDMAGLVQAFAEDPNATLYLAVSGLTVEQIALSLRSLDARRAQLRGTPFSETVSTGEGRDEVWTEIKLDREAGALTLGLADVTDMVAVELATSPANTAEAPGAASPTLDDIMPEMSTGMVLLQPDAPFGRINEAARALLGADNLRAARRQLDLLVGDVFSAPITRIAVRESRAGKVLTLAISASPVDLDGRRMSLVTITDVTDKMPVEEGQGSDLTATINHEMRTPLASLIGSLDLLAAELPEAEGRSEKLLNMSRRNAARLAALVEDLMLIHEADDGSLSVTLEDVPAREAIMEARDTMAGFAARHDVELSLEADLDEEAIVADPRRLQQVFANLISNAVKYSGDGRRVRLLARRSGGDIEFLVRDHGLGIPDADLPHIFGRYYRVDATNHRRVHGTGLGLAITRDLVDRMGGRICVSSSTGELSGSEFSLSFPISQKNHLLVDPR